MRGIIILGMALLAISGCSSTGSDKLIYAKNLTFGANVSSTGTAGPDITIGFKSQNLAIVPTVKDDQLIESTVSKEFNSGSQAADTDSMSVLGQFSADTSGSGVNLGEFFATGLAAQKLADGFKCEMAKDTSLCN